MRFRAFALAAAMLAAVPISAAAAEKGTEYVCPMHPEIRSDKPAVCSICNMKLMEADAQAQKGGRTAHCPCCSGHHGAPKGVS